MKPARLASFEAKNGTFRAISQKSLLGLECRGISGLHFFWNKHFCTSPLVKDIGPRSRKWPISGFPGNLVLGMIGRKRSPVAERGPPNSKIQNHRTQYTSLYTKIYAISDRPDARLPSLMLIQHPGGRPVPVSPKLYTRFGEIQIWRSWFGDYWRPLPPNHPQN